MPGEIMAVYVTVLGVLVPRTDRSKWGAFLGTLALLWFSVLLNNAVARRKAGSSAGGARAKKPGWTKQLLVAIVASAAFSTYVFSLPSSPLGQDSTRVATLVALALAMLLPQIGMLLNSDPDSPD